MKPDRRTFIIGAAVIAAVVFLNARQGQRPTCPGGSCSPMPINLNDWPSNARVAVEATNTKSAGLSNESLTNRNP